MNLAAIEKRSPTHTAPTQCASPPLVTGSSTSCPHFPTHPAPSPHTSSHLQDPVVLCRLLVHHNDGLRRHRRRLAVLQRGRGLGRPFFLLGLRTARAKQRHVRGGSALHTFHTSGDAGELGRAAYTHDQALLEQVAQERACSPHSTIPTPCSSRSPRCTFAWPCCL